MQYCRVYSQSVSAVLPAWFWSELCQLGRLVTTRWLLLPLLQHPLKHWEQLTAQDRHACRRICFEQVTMKNPVFCYSLVTISFITSASHSSCAESTSLPKILINILVYFIHSLNADYVLEHCKRQTANCPTVQGQDVILCPTLPLPFLTDH